MRVLPPTDTSVEFAADAIRRGELVAMPTETVYGVAANAFDAAAVRRIYALKGRPAENPMIVHIARMEDLDDLVADFPEAARVLAERFWPGPLTMVLRKAAGVPAEVTAGLDTIAVRMPRHPVALQLILAAGVPLAAPSANRFTRLSPTGPEHIDDELRAGLACVLDGGRSPVGLESTVVDMTGWPPHILRPGGVSRGDIQAALGVPLGQIPAARLRRSPGMYPRHYAPMARVVLVDRIQDGLPGLVFGEPAGPQQIRMPNDATAYASALYEALHRLDRENPETIFVERPVAGPEWEAVLDRLQKASAPA